MNTAILPRPSLQQFLDERLDAALDGEASIAIVTGDAGSGKTQLIQQFSKSAHSKSQDLLVAYAACNAITGVADAYMPFREILQQLSGDLDESLAEGYSNVDNVSRVRRFMQTSARALVENGPDLVDVFVPGGALLTRLGSKVAQRWTWFDKLTKQVELEKPRHLTAEIKQENIYEQYTRVIEAISEEAPLLLVVDDLHWSDQASLGLLFQLARRLVNNPVLIVGVTRPPEYSESTHELANVLNELRRYFGDIVLDLSKQPGDEFINDYLDAVGITVSPETKATLERYTGGNPLYVVELLRQVSSDDAIESFLQDIDARQLPERLTGIFEQLFHSLNEHDRQLLATASVQGLEFWAEVVADIHNGEPLSMIRRLSGTLQRERSIVVDAGSLELGRETVSRFRFRHDLLREYVYQSMSANEQRMTHKMVADQIEQRTSNSPENHCLALAEQFERAHDWEKALRYRIMAARRTEKACAPTEAASHYAAAVDLCRKINAGPDSNLFDLRLHLASQLGLAGEYSQAEDVAQAALESAADPNQSSIAWLEIARLLRGRREHAKSLEALAQAESVLLEDKSAKAWTQRLDILLERGVVAYFSRDPALLAKTNQTLEGVIEEQGTPEQQVSYFSSQSRQELIRNRFSPTSDARKFAKKAFDSAQPASASAIFGLAFSTLWEERFVESIALFETAENAATRHGDSAIRLQSLIYLTFAHRRLGNVQAVRDHSTTITTVLELVKMPEYPAVLWAQQAWLAYRDGDMKGAYEKSLSLSRNWRNSQFPFCWIGDWVTFATATPGSPESIAAAENMLSSDQAWQREDVVATLETYVSDDAATSEHHDIAVASAKRAGFL